MVVAGFGRGVGHGFGKRERGLAERSGSLTRGKSSSHGGAWLSGERGLVAATNRSSAQSGGMAVEVACLGNILFLLWRHFRGILTARYTARSKFSAGALVLG